MFKAELRLAVVIYGGASLAVYMHGVSKELLKLVRASKVLHQAGRERAATMRYARSAGDVDVGAADTEAVYFEILKRINRNRHFRVVLDVIAGASAGAINGVMLGKAIVDDAELDSQTPLWLNHADVESLVPENQSPWHRWYLYPLLRGLSFWLPRELRKNPETQEKLTQMVRSSWFEPPFSGARLCGHLLDSFEAMSASSQAESTLLPPGQQLDVYSSITDLVGYPASIRLHEGLAAEERQHGVFCRLSHVARTGDATGSDFHDENLPALVWAARASSSYAGAYAPFHHSELRGVLARRQLAWPGEKQFLDGNLLLRDGVPARVRFDPADRLFIDGGVVNNKPFEVVLDALSQRSADRHVDRYVVYIEPNPVDELPDEPTNMGYLSSIRAALTTIPRNQPILDELNEIVAQDNRVLMNRRLVEDNQEKIQRIVEGLETQHARQPLSPELVAYLRLGVSERAVEDMGLAFRAYVQRRVWRLTDALVSVWALLAEQPYSRETREAMLESVERWWEAETDVTRQNLQDVFLDRFDVTFRIRRLQFVIRRLNQHDEFSALSDRARDALDEFKRVAYQFLERLSGLRHGRFLDGPLLDRLSEAAGQIPLSREQSGKLLRALARSLDLDSLDRQIDEAFYNFCRRIEDLQVRRAFVSDYVGFSVYDVLLFTPGVEDGGPDPLTPIRIERISPEDSTTLNAAFTGLRCKDLMGFLGFFNRAYREHDYLWGRLNGADRVVDLLVNAAGEEIEDIEMLRLELFMVILKQERQRLYRCNEEFAELDKLIDQLMARLQC